MPSPRRFRFAIQCGTAGSGREWLDLARKAEALGYDALSVSDHPSHGLAFGPALAAAAAVTSDLRLAVSVLANDFRHPALVAREAATLDLLSDGRFELGLGAGWLGPDYEQTGIPLAAPRVRVDRLAEALVVIKALLAGGPVAFEGRHYTITGLTGFPKPVQRPRLPFMLGAGGRRMLALAAREAEIVSLLPVSRPDGSGFVLSDATALAFDHKVALVREAAPTRPVAPELNILLQRLIVDEPATEALAALSVDWAPLSPAELAESPVILAGSTDRIVETLQARRLRWGISYVTVFAAEIDAFAPIVARLAGS